MSAMLLIGTGHICFFVYKRLISFIIRFALYLVSSLGITIKFLTRRLLRF